MAKFCVAAALLVGFVLIPWARIWIDAARLAGRDDGI